ncbi:hypothetical protein GOP47_0003310 [Adiantum capillus-veneris]|uniref:Uncharacterized protein n=1 Tax=Adiantum capillus-veneris TaxID=13818 RepID=A0A9D4VC88_ADICA|nr:hypothetical protein GOP47_0003310 [Adiantum capillus-veneris]
MGRKWCDGDATERMENGSRCRHANEYGLWKVALFCGMTYAEGKLMEMVTMEELEHARSSPQESLTDLCSDMTVVFDLARPFSSPLLALPALPSDLAMAVMSLIPSQLEEEMAKALFSCFNLKKFEMMMLMLQQSWEFGGKQLEKKDKHRNFARANAETEMVLLEQVKM